MPGLTISTTPSPHTASWQLFRQLSASIRLPSSHCSPLTASSTPLPQLSMRQSALQPSPDTVLPSSHASGLTPPVGVNMLLTLPSPQLGTEQSPLQVWLLPPVSQVSLGGVLAMPSPHRGCWQLLRQASRSSLLPSSHCSP